jgi:hypothetical protein
MHHGDIWFTWPLFLILLVRQKIFGGAFWRWFARKKNTTVHFLLKFSQALTQGQKLLEVSLLGTLTLPRQRMQV